MIAAMMLPSSLPLVRMFAAASARQPRPGAAMAGFLGGYALVWSAFGALAFLFDVGVHAAVDSSPWLADHDWLLGGSVLALAGAFQFTTLKDACLDKCRHPGHFLIRFYERGHGGRLSARRPPRGVLPRLLLGADARDVLGRGGEPGVDGGPHRPDGLREDAAVRRPLGTGHRASPCSATASIVLLVLRLWRLSRHEPAPPGVEASDQITPAELRLATRNHGFPLEALAYDVTPAGLHYLLIHYDIPVVDPSGWRLSVDGCVERELSLSIDDLRSRPSVTLAVTLECAGNGRAQLSPRPLSQPWLLEAVGTAEWTGTPLRGVLEEAGMNGDAD